MPWKTPFSSDKLTLSRPNPPTSLSSLSEQTNLVWCPEGWTSAHGFPQGAHMQAPGPRATLLPCRLLGNDCTYTHTHTHTHTFFSLSREKQGNVHLLRGLSTPSNIACAGLSRGSPSECAPRAENVASGPNARSPPRCGGCCCSFCSANTQEFAGGKGGLPSDSSLSWGNKEACKSSLCPCEA